MQQIDPDPDNQQGTIIASKPSVAKPPRVGQRQSTSSFKHCIVLVKVVREKPVGGGEQATKKKKKSGGAGRGFTTWEGTVDYRFRAPRSFFFFLFCFVGHSTRLAAASYAARFYLQTYGIAMGTSAGSRRRFLGLTVSTLCICSAEAAGNAEVFDLWSKLKSFEYTVVRHTTPVPE